MPPTMLSTSLVLSAVALTCAAVAGCGGSAAAGQRTTITSSDNACVLSTTTLRAGDNTFAISNTGKSTTEVYLYARQDGRFTKVVEEKEHIGPGTTATLSAYLQAGSYEVACKPGEKGDGIRAPITVR